MIKLGIEIFRWLFVESAARWLFYILLAEYLIATNLSPTILSDYSILNALVETMAFIPAIHNFDEIATHPEAVRFYIALAILLIIPKSICIYHWLSMHPVKEFRQYVISPLTDKKPMSSSQVFTEISLTPEQVDALPYKTRSMASRIFWSVMIVLFTVAMVYVWVFINGFKTDDVFVLKGQYRIASGGVGMWFQFSLKGTTFSALLLAASAFIGRDYFRYIAARFHR